MQCNITNIILLLVIYIGWLISEILFQNTTSMKSQYRNKFKLNHDKILK